MASSLRGSSSDSWSDTAYDEIPSDFFTFSTPLSFRGRGVLGETESLNSMPKLISQDEFPDDSEERNSPPWRPCTSHPAEAPLSFDLSTSKPSPYDRSEDCRSDTSSADSLKDPFSRRRRPAEYVHRPPVWHIEPLVEDPNCLLSPRSNSDTDFPLEFSLGDHLHICQFCSRTERTKHLGSEPTSEFGKWFDFHARPRFTNTFLDGYNEQLNRMASTWREEPFTVAMADVQYSSNSPNMENQTPLLDSADREPQTSTSNQPQDASEGLAQGAVQSFSGEEDNIEDPRALRGANPNCFKTCERGCKRKCEKHFSAQEPTCDGAGVGQTHSRGGISEADFASAVDQQSEPGRGEEMEQLPSIEGGGSTEAGDQPTTPLPAQPSVPAEGVDFKQDGTCEQYLLHLYKDIRVSTSENDEQFGIKSGSRVICVGDTNISSTACDEFHLELGTAFIVLQMYGDLWASCLKLSLKSPVRSVFVAGNSWLTRRRRYVWPAEPDLIKFLPLSSVTLEENFGEYLQRRPGFGPGTISALSLAPCNGQVVTPPQRKQTLKAATHLRKGGSILIPRWMVKECCNIHRMPDDRISVPSDMMYADYGHVEEPIVYAILNHKGRSGTDDRSFRGLISDSIGRQQAKLEAKHRTIEAKCTAKNGRVFGVLRRKTGASSSAFDDPIIEPTAGMGYGTTTERFFHRAREIAQAEGRQMSEIVPNPENYSPTPVLPYPISAPASRPTSVSDVHELPGRFQEFSRPQQPSNPPDHVMSGAAQGTTVRDFSTGGPLLNGVGEAGPSNPDPSGAGPGGPGPNGTGPNDASYISDQCANCHCGSCTHGSGPDDTGPCGDCPCNLNPGEVAPCGSCHCGSCPCGPDRYGACPCSSAANNTGSPCRSPSRSGSPPRDTGPGGCVNTEPRENSIPLEHSAFYENSTFMNTKASQAGVGLPRTDVSETSTSGLDNEPSNQPPQNTQPGATKKTPARPNRGSESGEQGTTPGPSNAGAESNDRTIAEANDRMRGRKTVWPHWSDRLRMTRRSQNSQSGSGS